MLRLTLSSILLLSFALPATIAIAQTAPEASEQKTDDSDLFALPTDKPSLAEAMATVDDRLAEATKRADEAEKLLEAAEKDIEAAEKDFEAAKKDIEAAKLKDAAIDKVLQGLEDLGNSKSNDSDLFALPTKKTPMEIAREKAKSADVNRMASEEQLKASEEKIELLDDIQKEVDVIGKRINGE